MWIHIGLRLGPSTDGSKEKAKQLNSGGLALPQVQWRDDPDALQRWKEGRTGLPLVDANMREMAQTGAQRTGVGLKCRTSP